MGVLDELRGRAETARRDRAVHSASERARRALVEERLRPAMAALAGYFKELVEHLRDAPPGVKVGYRIDGFGTLSRLSQGEYRFAVDEHPGGLGRITVSALCGTGRRHERRLPDSMAVSLIRSLRALGITVHPVPAGAGYVRLRVKGQVPVRLTFDADLDREGVRLRVLNLPELGVAEQLVGIERIDRELMEELARLLLRQPSRHAELLGNRLPEAQREALQREIDRSHRRKAAELRGPLALALFRIGDWVGRRLRG
jgi:hypothetical protein